ncbi:hypothetical protein L3X38_043232 [Prunus dulcis]|uniref:Uncharacterized protein n=1 Tax=Prunus dulcis TaxID=3755 RepID=A0AAD4UY68_PRUDU|nr:hypothetical protein L3X38_043232 [Prunus dulcis]
MKNFPERAKTPQFSLPEFNSWEATGPLTTSRVEADSDFQETTGHFQAESHATGHSHPATGQFQAELLVSHPTSTNGDGVMCLICICPPPSRTRPFLRAHWLRSHGNSEVGARAILG